MSLNFWNYYEREIKFLIFNLKLYKEKIKFKITYYKSIEYFRHFFSLASSDVIHMTFCFVYLEENRSLYQKKVIVVFPEFLFSFGYLKL